MAWVPESLSGRVTFNEYDELSRLDRSTGSTLSQTHLPGVVGSMLTAGGWLWVTATAFPSQGGLGTTTVYKLDPVTLATHGSWVAPGSSMVSSGGALWLAGDGRLEARDPSSGRLLRTTSVPAANNVSMSTNPSGNVLLLAETNGEGDARIEQRDTKTGSVLQSASIAGPVSVIVTGPLDGQFWLSITYGMSGTVTRNDLSTLQPAGPSCGGGQDTDACTAGSNGVHALAADGKLWIVQQEGGYSDRNICVDPVTNARLAPLPVTANDRVLAVGSTAIYAQDATTGKVSALPIPAACT